MASSHLCVHCEDIPRAIREELLRLKQIKQNPGGGKDYWACGVQSKGIVETNDGLRFAPSTGLSSQVSNIYGGGGGFDVAGGSSDGGWLENTK